MIAFPILVAIHAACTIAYIAAAFYWKHIQKQRIALLSEAIAAERERCLRIANHFIKALEETNPQEASLLSSFITHSVRDESIQ